MNTVKNLPGIHHITAISSAPQENLAFYEGVLGLRLVKQTVNFDDPFTYHLYYGDQQGNPGTIITFFPWKHAPRGRNGTGMITAIAFAVAPEAMEYWKQRLASHHVSTTEAVRFGAPVLRFQDPHGLLLELVADSGAPDHDGSHPAASLDTSIRGFHSATALLSELEPTRRLLEDHMNMELHKVEGNRYRFVTGRDHAVGRHFDVLHDPRGAPGRQGSGTAHHIAFRTVSAEQQIRWQEDLTEAGYFVSPVRDRKYFRSIYFNEPGGILFEIATDPPGFGVDEKADQLGGALMLPEQYEAMRREIEQRLQPLRSEALAHVYDSRTAKVDDQTTIIALHGTGGDEHDLLPLARRIHPASAIISPRGQVVENGMNRFFKRSAPGVFDEREIVQRAHELADFIGESATRYRRAADRLIALGYSNGANIAAALLFLRPDLFHAGLLLRPMRVLASPPRANLGGKPVLIARGRHDRVIPAASTDRLIDDLRTAGARVHVLEVEAGHELTEAELGSAAQWLEQNLSAVPVH